MRISYVTASICLCITVFCPAQEQSHSNTQGIKKEQLNGDGQQLTHNYHDKLDQKKFLAAVKSGNVNSLKNYLVAGFLPDTCDEYGKTALHYATSKGHAHAAALLLLYGADYTKKDKSGKTALDASRIPYETLHEIRELMQSLPSPSFRKVTTNEWVRVIEEKLNRDGIVKISDFIAEHELKILQNDFEAFIEYTNKIPQETLFASRVAEEFYSNDEQALITNNPFKYSPFLTALCCNPIITSIINNYLGKIGYVTKGWAARYFPGGKSGAGVFSWHHDAAGKRLKMMILLRDVNEDSRYMQYATGTHVLHYPYRCYQENTGLDLASYQKNLEQESTIFKAIGKAGDIFLFDTNGIHTATARNGNGRDAFLITYTADKSHIWGCSLTPDLQQQASQNPHHPFYRMACIVQTRGSLTPYHKRWVKSLINLESWL